ncbi:hypothetical protein T492DRAFT_1092864 [Pavlovales sp. CCMP2436]|nr:hypothetical protein T492DRAFT_1092864 [Pavlovales sp. CCMP2436]
MLRGVSFISGVVQDSLYHLRLRLSFQGNYHFWVTTSLIISRLIIYFTTSLLESERIFPWSMLLIYYIIIPLETFHRRRFMVTSTIIINSLAALTRAHYRSSIGTRGGAQASVAD